jgi:cytochrome c peroxidase
MSDVPEARLELGRLLFHDPIMSIDKEIACSTCHSDKWGMSDGLTRAVGHGAGLLAGAQRSGGRVGRRNSQALFNLAFRTTLLWDGRAESLEEQAMMPLESEDEMAIDPEVVAADLAGIEEYVELFEAAFPDDPRVSVENMSSALAAMQRTIVSNRSLYDGYVGGDLGALDDDVIEGMFRFAEYGCDGCHTPPLFESEVFTNRNVPEVEGVEDDGLAEVTEDQGDRGKFRTPSLRNAGLTSPYFHNGSVMTLEDAVRHELEQGGEPYTEEDVSLIFLFVGRALKDDTKKPDRPLSVPSGLTLPVDLGT